VPGRPPALQLTDISKTYGATRALRDVSLSVDGGELRALAGGNGSGKSTLVKILAGVVTADGGGEISIGETRIPAERMSPTLAREAGLHFVHQDPAVFPEMTVADNLFLGDGFASVGRFHISKSASRRRAQHLLDRFEIDARPSDRIGELTAGRRTMVAIARALQDQREDESGILILDEPTASLPGKEIGELLERMHRYAEAGHAVVYISHHLDEIVGVADSITVLRDGQRVAELAGEGLTEKQLIGHIVGRPLDEVFPQAPTSPEGEVVLEVKNLRARGLEDVSLTLNQGEIVGIAGLLGSGRSTLLRAIFGDIGREDGELLLDGKPLASRSPREAMASGIAYIPEDRKAEAAFMEMPLRQNLAAASVPEFGRFGKIDGRAERKEAERLIADFGIKAESADQPLFTLSGGNQQKVILARWLRRRPRVLLLDEPTQGVDIGARAEIYSTVREAVTAGASVLLAASDFEELAELSDRVLILGNGTIDGQVTGPNIDPDHLTELTYGRRLERR
jgi:ribose transport system ATP-binding protein